MLAQNSEVSEITPHASYQVSLLFIHTHTHTHIQTHTCIAKNRLPLWLSGKESTCQCERWRFTPEVGKIPRRRKWQPTPVFLSEKSQEQRSLVSYSPWGPKRIRHDLTTKQQQLPRTQDPKAGTQFAPHHKNSIQNNNWAWDSHTPSPRGQHSETKMFTFSWIRFVSKWKKPHVRRF